jgi:hypothetical protein
MLHKYYVLFFTSLKWLCVILVVVWGFVFMRIWVEWLGQRSAYSTSDLLYVSSGFGVVVCSLVFAVVGLRKLRKKEHRRER